MRKSFFAAIAAAAVLAPAGVAAAGTPPPDQSALARIPVTCTFTDAMLTMHTSGFAFWLDGHHYLITTEYADGVPFATHGEKTGLPVAGHCTSELPGFEWYSADVVKVW
jgi:hypothetical protein